LNLSIPFVIRFANVVAAQLYGDGLAFPLVCFIIAAGVIAIGLFNGAISASLGYIC
jgi:ribose transport system permease protein